MEPEQIIHIHMGPGKLGLGLIVPTMTENRARGIEMKTVIIGRRGTKNFSRFDGLINSLSYELRTTNNDSLTSKPIKIDHFYCNDQEAESQRIIEYFKQPSPIIFTISIRSNLEVITKFLVNALIIRSSYSITNDVLIIACENPPNDTYHLQELLKEEVKSRTGVISPQHQSRILENTFFIPTLVDRICCNDPHLDEQTPYIDGVEEFKEWILYSPPEQFQRIKHYFPDSIKFILSEEQFNFLSRRKALLVNGTLFAIACDCFAKNRKTMQSTLVMPKSREQIVLFQMGLVACLHLIGLEQDIPTDEAKFESLTTYAKDVLTRITIGPRDKPKRILEEWILWDGTKVAFHRLIKKVMRRSVRPIEQVMDSGLMRDNSNVTSAMTEFFINFIRMLEGVTAEINETNNIPIE